MYFKKSYNFYFFHLIVKNLDVFNFHPFFSIVIVNFRLTSEIWTLFLKIYIKSGNITAKKKKSLTDFSYFLILKHQQNRKNWTQEKVYCYMEKRTEPLWFNIPYVLKKKWKRQQLEKIEVLDWDTLETLKFQLCF